MGVLRRLGDARSCPRRRAIRGRARRDPCVILLCGIPTETPLAMVADALSALGARYCVLNQRRVSDCDMSWQIEAGSANGTLRLGEETLHLTDISAVYLRLM